MMNPINLKYMHNIHFGNEDVVGISVVYTG